AGWWTAVVLFVLMGISQFISMKLPQWMQKARTKNVKKLSKNPAQDKQSKQMKWFSNIMLVMIVVMGFSLPAAMGVYWFIGAIISVIQTLIMQTIMARSKK
ncbi:MAG TPA: YidC/Oxa1 family membrane protein insertase, partial [Bacilli bacterium]|nr:YidC/Oxa1 family membrane protein insertase [Bacilli bacterium]